MKKHIKVCFTFLFFLPLLQGCWNQEELTNLAIVMALGIDKAEHNQGYVLTLEIVNPGNVASSFMGGGQGAPVAVYKSKGKTLFEASRKASKELSRKVYYAHANAVVISEQLAKEGILDLLDVLDRDPVFRTTTQIFIAKNSTAEKVVSTLTILDKIPANKLIKAMDVTEQMLGENTKVTVEDFINSIVIGGKEPIVNGIVLSGKKDMGENMSNIATDKPMVIIKLDGMAIFKGGKLIGWIDGVKARGIVWTMKKVKSTDVFIDWQGKKKAIGVIIRRSIVKVSPYIKNGSPGIQIAIKTEGDLEQVDGAVDITNPAVIKKMEDMFEEEIKKEVTNSVTSVQRKKSDVFGFGEYVRRKYPKGWKKFKNHWDDEFAAMEVSVKTDVFLRRNGIRNKPLWSTINQ